MPEANAPAGRQSCAGATLSLFPARQRYAMTRKSTPIRLVLAWTFLSLLAAVVAVVMTAGAGLFYKHRLVTLGTAFGLLRHGAWVGIFAAAAGLLGLLAALIARRPKASLPAIFALALGLGAFIWPYTLAQGAKAVPPIHDIATDPMHAPRFLALAKARAKAPNGTDYGGGGAGMARSEKAALAHFLASPTGRKNPRHKQVEAACAAWGPGCLAAVQHAYYPGIRPLPAPGISPQVAYTAALATARAMGWHIATADPHAGHIEATATTVWFGFKDDVAINVTPAGQGCIVNVRSESRLGLSDLGKNARRVRTYLHRLANRFTHLHK